ncbi:MAG: hypothetical protein M1819_003958 [Sarea resinae]|nr:MAG: hypothetical protein M1819_003958 [Sarea resinae]
MSTLDALQDLSLSGSTLNAPSPSERFARFASKDKDDYVDVEYFPEEEEVLQLHDRLQELRLDSTILEALKKNDSGREIDAMTEDEVSHRLDITKKEVLEARAAYILRRQTVDTILLTDPFINAVHSVYATVPERDLLNLMIRRDVLSMAHTNLSNSLASSLSTLSKLEMDNITITKSNQELAAVMLDLAEKTKVQTVEEVHDPKMRSQLTELKEQNVKERTKWRVMKSVVAAAVVGSGIDWARDPDLRDLVLDDEEDTP